MPEVKRLYKINLPSRVMCEPTDGSRYIDVDHLDGSYSFGKTEKGAVVHLGVGTPLVANQDGTWRIATVVEVAMAQQPDGGSHV